MVGRARVNGRQGLAGCGKIIALGHAAVKSPSKFAFMADKLRAFAGLRLVWPTLVAFLPIC
jgi:hypothetical protein